MSTFLFDATIPHSSTFNYDATGGQMKMFELVSCYKVVGEIYCKMLLYKAYKEVLFNYSRSPSKRRVSHHVHC